MERRSALLVAAALVLAPTAVRAQMGVMRSPPSQAPMTPVEEAFYHRAAPLLEKLYPDPAAAERAGYFRFTNEDRTGAISYENRDPKWFNSDISHPQQLWYGVDGRLLGADYSQTPDRAPNGPTLFGLSPSRFHHIPLHVHFGLKEPDGTIRYGLYVSAADFKAAGGDPELPTAETLVKMGKASSVGQVAFVFGLLANDDAQMWVIPNPDGQFASANPNVKPSPDQGGGSGERRM